MAVARVGAPTLGVIGWDCTSTIIGSHSFYAAAICRQSGVAAIELWSFGRRAGQTVACTCVKVFMLSGDGYRPSTLIHKALIGECCRRATIGFGRSTPVVNRAGPSSRPARFR